MPDDLCIKEKVVEYGTPALTNVELLSTVLRTGLSEEDAMELSRVILSQDGLDGLQSYQLSELLRVKGIGQSKAVMINVIVELSKRMWRSNLGEKKNMSNPSLVADYYMQEMRLLDHEELWVAFLDSRSSLISDYLASKGSINASTFPKREVMREALRRNAVSLILVHNHPSAFCKPSDADIGSTKSFSEACKIMGLHLQDHIIIGGNQYYSFKEWGTL